MWIFIPLLSPSALPPSVAATKEAFKGSFATKNGNFRVTPPLLQGGKTASFLQNPTKFLLTHTKTAFHSLKTALVAGP